ncbi:hypothetical protein GCM10020219_036790 [Nonomuraea dietziae]
MYDIVLFGASGFTGALTAEYLAEAVPPGCRWALAGRDRAKLEALGHDVPSARRRHTTPPPSPPLAEQARVVATTVGPYIRYGEPLVKACARAGTHYVDLTGEHEFVDRMFVRYDGMARSTGAKIVHACGFDSIPYDLGVLHTVDQLPSGVPLKVSGFVRSNGRASGGTVHSAVTAMSRVRQMAEAGTQRRSAEIRPKDRRVSSLPGGLRYVGGWGAAHAHHRPPDRRPLGPRARSLRARLRPTASTSRSGGCPPRWHWPRGRARWPYSPRSPLPATG